MYLERGFYFFCGVAKAEMRMFTSQFYLQTLSVGPASGNITHESCSTVLQVYWFTNPTVFLY